MWLPIIFLLLAGIIQFGKITYIYYSLQKTVTSIASYLAVQNGVNFCPDAGDPTITAAIKLLNHRDYGWQRSDGDCGSHSGHVQRDHAVYRPGDADAGRLRVVRLRLAGGRATAGFFDCVDAQRVHHSAADSVHSFGPDCAQAAGRDGLWGWVMRRVRQASRPASSSLTARKRARQARRPVLHEAALGQSSVEFALLYSAAILPLTFMIIFTSELLWIWHSVADFTRDGARYAATHCWQGDGSNVVTYMKANIPLMPYQDQFLTGPRISTSRIFRGTPIRGR